MATKDITLWVYQNGKLRRTGEPDEIPASFPTFDVGTVMPIGYKDQLAGLGTRNVGPRGSLSVHMGDKIIGAGEVVSGLEIFGRALFTGQAEMYDCVVHGATVPSNSQDSAINGWNGSALTYNLYGSLIDHCRIDILTNNAFTNGLEGGNFTFTHGEVYGGVDGFGLNSTVGNGKIWASRISHGFYHSWWNDAGGGANGVRRTSGYTDADGRVWGTPPNQSSGDAHSDAVQLTQGGGYQLLGSNLGGTRQIPYDLRLDPTIRADLDKILAMRESSEYLFSCLQISNGNPSYPSGILVEGNWMQGGSSTVGLAEKPDDHMSGIIIRNNKLFRPVQVSNGAQYGYPFYVQNLQLPDPTNASSTGPGSNLATITGNKWFDAPGGADIAVTYFN